MSEVFHMTFFYICNCLTQWGKMSDILQMAMSDILKVFFFNNKDLILIRFTLNFVLKGPIDKKSALVQEMAWHRKGDKPPPKPMMTQSTGAYKHHQALIS